MTQAEYADALSEGLAPLLDKLDDIGAMLDFQIQINSGIIFFLGLVAGILFMTILWGRFK